MDYETDDWAYGKAEFCDSELGVDLDSFPSPGRSTEQIVEERQMLEAALGWLSEAQRGAVLLWANGWKFKEIGEKLGVSGQRAHQLVRAGLDRMKSKVGYWAYGLPGRKTN